MPFGGGSSYFSSLLFPDIGKKKHRRRVSAMKEDYEVQFSKLELQFFSFIPSFRIN